MVNLSAWIISDEKLRHILKKARGEVFPQIFSTIALISRSCWPRTAFLSRFLTRMIEKLSSITKTPSILQIAGFHCRATQKYNQNYQVKQSRIRGIIED